MDGRPGFGVRLTQSQLHEARLRSLTVVEEASYSWGERRRGADGACLRISSLEASVFSVK